MEETLSRSLPERRADRARCRTERLRHALADPTLDKDPVLSEPIAPAGVGASYEELGHWPDEGARVRPRRG